VSDSNTPAASPADAAAAAIGYRFKHPDLLTEALTHPSAIEAAPRRRGRRRPVRGHGYERLEFLGDRVLGLVVAELLWRRFENEPEGALTRRLAALVRRDAVARVAAEIGLDRHLILSRSEAAAGAARNSGILADVCEAVIAAIYVDGGFEAARDFIERCWEPLVGEMAVPPRDPKTTLQEWAQGRGLGLPVYRLIEASGPDHVRRFTVGVQVEGSDEASATASSKRAAETAAAAALLERLVPTT
jgi:ribonuclease-3